MKKKKWLLVYLLLVILFTYLFAFIPPVYAQPKTKTIYFGIDKDFPPYSWKDKDGEVKGFYVDIYNYIAPKLEEEGYHTQAVVESGPQIMEMFDKDEIQVIMGMSITPERKKKYYFTTPLHILRYKMYTIKHKYIKSIDDLKNPVSPLTIGVLKNSSAEVYIRENFPSLFIKEYPSVEEAIKALIENKIDLLMGYEYIVQYYLDNYLKNAADTVYPLPIDFPGGHKWHAIAINKNHEDLAYKIDEIIKDMSESGKLAEISSKWFGQEEQTFSRSTLLYYILLAVIGIISVGIAYHIQLTNATRKLRTLIKEKEDQRNQLEYQMNELMAAREELTAMSEQLMAQQEELTYLYENERSLKTQLEKQNDFLSTLLAFFRVPEKGSDFTTQLKNFLVKTKDAFSASGVYLYKYLPETDMLSLISYAGHPKPSPTLPPGLVQAFLLGKTTFLPASADPAASVLGAKEGFILVVPLIALKEKKGVLMLYFSKEIPDNEKTHIVSILENLAPSLGIYMENMMVIETHLAEMVKLRELLQFIEKAITITDIDTLLKQFTTFARQISGMEYACLLDREGNILYATNENIEHCLDIIKKHIDKEDEIFYDEKSQLHFFILNVDIREYQYKLVVFSTLSEVSSDEMRSNTYFIKLVTRFISIYASNILYAKKLENLLKMRAKESALLKGIVEHTLKTEYVDENLVITLAQIMERSGIPTRVEKDGHILYGKADITEVDTITITYRDEEYTLILGDKIQEHLKSTIKMWIRLRQEKATWAQRLEESRSEWLGIIDSTPYPLVAIDENGIINKVNKAFASLIDKPIEEILGKHIEEILPGVRAACDSGVWQDWHCYEWIVDDISIGKILIKGEV